MNKFQRTKDTKKISLFLDSGAFSAFTKGVEIDIDKYIDFIKEHIDYIDVYANLDVIGDAEATLENQKYMEKAGLTPLPCFHVKEDFSYLKYYVDNYDYIALGGVAQAGRQAQIWMDDCFDMICDDKGMPKCKVHGFAVTSLKLMLRYPWYSVDSTSWVITSRMGGVYVPRYRKGKWIYDENSWKIFTSSRSPSKGKEGRHIETLPPNVKKEILRYFDEKGYQLGESAFRWQKTKGYTLGDNERWFDDEVNGERQIETVVIPGLCNDYKQRDEMNIIYFLDLEKHIPKWPWPYKRQGMKGFGL